MRFADPNATDRLDLGACECSGTPHESDWVEYRTQIGYATLGAVATVAASVDLMSAKRKLLELTITGWNLLGPDGEIAEITPKTIGDLDPSTAERIYDAVDSAIQAVQTLPNASGARSPASSRASASRTRHPTRIPMTS